MTLLSVQDLHVRFRTAAGEVRAVDGVSFELAEGESLGLVGESGCGKTTVAKAILRLLAPNGSIPEGRIVFRGRDLLRMPPEEFRQERWRHIALVTQSAMNALDPVYRAGTQIVEAIRAHETCSRREAWQRAARLFEAVGLEPTRLHQYSHQFSGGMRQRAIIAMALALGPELIIADEPTTALDVVIQDQVFEEFERLQRGGRKALILITHDISLVAENCGRVAVMYAGQIVEMASAREIFANPLHPYTIGLQNAFPNLRRRSRELISIPGAPPNLAAPIEGCRFAPRCPFGQARCTHEAPLLAPAGEGHLIACHFADSAGEFRERGRSAETWERNEAGRMARMG